MSPRVLPVDDEANIRRMVAALLQSDGFETVEAPDGTAALARLDEDAPDVVLLDLMMPPGPDGLATLEQIRRRAPLAPPRRLPQTPRLPERLGHAAPLIGTSAAMEELRAMIARVAPTETRVLITGESGTGKELVASAIHRQSAREAKPFVTVNSAAIPRDLVESEMFGHERGAFTGATERRLGRFELADGGTLFLDEVGDLGLDAQAKLLRVLESGVVQRVGGERPFAVDVRVIAATNKELDQAVKRNQFREDLWFRLNVLPIHIPPLRERPEDVPPLVKHFAARFAARLGRPARFDAGALPLLAAYDWPGNVRELANIIERMAILSNAQVITADDVARVLPGSVAPVAAASQPRPHGAWQDIALAETRDQYERELIAKALSAAKGNVAEAARRLQTDRANLYRRMRRLGIEPPLKADQ